MNSKIIALVLGFALAVTSFTGCASPDNDIRDIIATDNAAENVGGDAGASYDTNVTVYDLDPKELFTDRDKEIIYDESTATKIVLSDTGTEISGTSATAADNCITISDEGTYILSGSLSNGQIIVDTDDKKVQLVLDNVDINCDSSAAIYVRQADKVFITLAPDSINNLSNTQEFVAIDDNNIDAVVFSKSDLTLNGNGTLNVNAAYGHGILSKNDLKFTGGSYVVCAASSAISGKNSVRIASGDYNITAGKDGIHAENTDEEEKGFVYISDGSFTINANSDALDASFTLQVDGGKFMIDCKDDAFHSDTDLIINGGEINITASYEGLEGKNITINGGTIDLCSSDDGLNAAGGNDQSGFGPGGNDTFRGAGDSSAITVNGGVIKVNAEGDGIDTNGNLVMNGGELYISGPVDNNNAAIDYDGNAVINGGICVAAGSGGMAQNFGFDSTQGSILINVPSSADAGMEVKLTDSEGNIPASFVPDKAYNSVLISCPDIKDGETYTITANGNDIAVTMDGLIYGNNMAGGLGPHGNKSFEKPPLEFHPKPY